MPDFTRLIQAVENGDPTAADELLPLVYDELRRLAQFKMNNEAPGQTLQPTALVHEAWLRLIGSNQDWRDSRHFVNAAAEADSAEEPAPFGSNSRTSISPQTHLTKACSPSMMRLTDSPNSNPPKPNSSNSAITPDSASPKPPKPSTFPNPPPNANGPLPGPGYFAN